MGMVQVGGEEIRLDNLSGRLRFQQIIQTKHETGAAPDYFSRKQIMAKKKANLKSSVQIYCAYDELRDPAALIENPRNPNKHPKDQIALLAKIIQHQGWRAPITVSKQSGFIVRGHCRLYAALVLKLDAVPIDLQDYATQADEHADLIADNRIGELAEMDLGILKDVLLELDVGDFDMDFTGFDTAAIEGLMTQFHPGTPVDLDNRSSSGGELHKCPKCGFSFEDNK
jgi:hypothetical protein